MISQSAIDREMVRRGGLIEFIRRNWHLVEPAQPYMENWHHRLLCRKLEETVTGETRRLVINIPPGCTKSLITGVFFPAWLWSLHPEKRVITASHDIELVRRDAQRTKNLIDSPYYQERWGDRVQIDHSFSVADTKTLYYTTRTGMRFATTVAGKAVGWHGNYQLCDDPTKPADAAAATTANLEASIEWWRHTMSSRLLDASTAVRAVIMQRVHEDDLAGYCISHGYDHICLPMTYDPHHPYTHPDDPRHPGELLWPEMFPEASVAELRDAMGPDIAAAQLDQLPVAPGGSVFHGEWLSQFWDSLPAHGVWLTSWDHTFGSLKKTASYVVGQVWFISGRDSYLIDQVRGRWEFPQMISEMKSLAARYPQCMTHLVEAKASGPAIEQTLRNSIMGIKMVSADSSTGGKLARARSITPLFASGNVYFPRKPWVEQMLLRFKRFRGVDADVSDEIDTCSQALTHAHGTGSARFLAAMDKAKSRSAA